MAIPELNTPSFSASLLFQRLPDRIFAPLASTNRHRYWALLCHLYERRFGPDAPLPPSRGFSSKVIVKDIAEALELQDAWDNEESCSMDTPIDQRAAAIFNRFHECGWIRIDQPRFDRRVIMQPTVSQFLTMLVSFAETGPVFVSGKIRSIDANLQMVMDGNASGDSLSEAAEQARNLLEHVRNTGTNIRDLMESLHQDSTTSQYVQKFFSSYIERVFIGDYRELRTTEHPLAKRAQILARIEELSESEDHKKRLIAWYESKRCPGDFKKAERLFDRDIQRLSELRRIDEYLDRLDDEIRRANKRALAFLDYRLRSLMPADMLVNQAIDSILKTGFPLTGDPFTSGEMMSESRLAEPRKVVERAPPSALRKVVVSDEQMAKSNIMLRARTSRTVTAVNLAAYAKDQLEGKNAISSEDLVIGNISDVRMFQTLSMLSLQMSAKGRKLRMDAIAMTKGFRVETNNGQEMPSEYISSVPFTVETHKVESK